ncbi:DUF3313 domain-containing protein [Vibrio alfacsensis]|uniref:DUF3313 domain-containing protein n=1 Tax=Vibrio alfacsensis TaxID=1074311 RepID=A0ABN5PIZ2_9VIBR|nr:DUF3313 domain-containing protein [Vibrio alfacsensis]AXY03181.1 DUF3313 domain-containing protein [Vibrio alfacsensis]
MLKSLVKCISVSLLGAVLAGCAGGPIVSGTTFTSYEDFRAGPEGGVDLVWARVGLRDATRLKNKLDEYDSVVIDRVMVVVKESELDDDEISELTTYMVDKLKTRISPVKKMVEQPGEKTLRLSIAISNVETPNPVLAVTSSILPVGLGISTISKITTGEHTNVGSATVELLVSDSQSDTPLFAAIDRQAGNKDFSTMIDSLDDAKDAINWWVDRLGVTLSQDLSQTTL